MFDRALRQYFLAEFLESDLSVAIGVEFLNDLSGLFLAQVEAFLLDDLLELCGADLAVIVDVQGVKGLVDVEVRVALQSLAHLLGLHFDLEVGAPHASELDCRVRVEAVVASVHGRSVVLCPALQHVGVVGVHSQEGILEFVQGQLHVPIVVVSYKEQVHFFAGWVHTDRCEAVPHFCR